MTERVPKILASLPACRHGGLTARPNHGHGKVWKAKAKELGCNGSRCCDRSVVAPSTKWIAECPGCRREVEDIGGGSLPAGCAAVARSTRDTNYTGKWCRHKGCVSGKMSQSKPTRVLSCQQVTSCHGNFPPRFRVNRGSAKSAESADFSPAALPGKCFGGKRKALQVGQQFFLGEMSASYSLLWVIGGAERYRWSCDGLDSVLQNSLHRFCV